MSDFKAEMHQIQLRVRSPDSLAGLRVLLLREGKESGREGGERGEDTEFGFRNTGASTQCRTRVLIGSRVWDYRREPKSTAEGYNRKYRIILRLGKPKGTSGKAA